MAFEKPNLQSQTMPKDEFFAKARALTAEETRQLGIGEKKKDSAREKSVSGVAATFRNPETGVEQSIEINLEEKMAEAKNFYKNHFNLDIAEAEIRSIWKEHYVEIKSEIEKYGYDSVLIIPDNLPEETEINEQAIETMDEGAGKGQVVATKYWAEQKSIASVTENKYKIILVHEAQNLDDQPVLKVTKGKNIPSLTGINPEEVTKRIASGQELPIDFETAMGGKQFEVKGDGLSLEEYEIFQRMYFEKTGQHLDVNGATWLLKSFSGSRVVAARWFPSARQLDVHALGSSASSGGLGLRLSRSFSN